MCQKEEASESFMPAIVLHPAYIYTFCLCSGVTSRSTLVTQTQLPEVIFIKAFHCVGRGRRSGLRSFSVCLHFAGVFLEEKNIKNTEERKSFPDNTAEQVNATADIHSRKIKETLKEKAPFHIFILEEMRAVKQLIVTSLTPWPYPSKPKGIPTANAVEKSGEMSLHWIFA